MLRGTELSSSCPGLDQQEYSRSCREANYPHVSEWLDGLEQSEEVEDDESED